MGFSVWLLSLSVMFLRFIHVVAHVSTSSLPMADSYFIVCRYQILFIHCLLNIFPPPLAAVNYATCLYKYLFESLLSILIYLGVELLGHIVILFFNKKKLLLCVFCLCWVFVAAQVFCCWGARGVPFAVVHRLLIAVASLVMKHRL